MPEKKRDGRFRICPSFYICAVVFIFYGDFSFFLIFSLSIFLHELMHYFMASTLGYKTESFSLAAFGARLNLDTEFLDSRDEVLVAIVGPLFNLLLAVALVCFWWIYPISYAYTDLIVRANIYIFLVNLLPVLPLDGGRVIKGLFFNKNNEKNLKKFFFIISLILSIIFFGIFFLVKSSTSLFLALFLLINLFENRKNGKILEFGKKFSKKVGNKGREIRFFKFEENATLLQLYRKISEKYYTIFIISSRGKNIEIKEEKLFLLLQLASPKKRIYELFK